MTQTVLEKLKMMLSNVLGSDKETDDKIAKGVPEQQELPPKEFTSENVGQYLKITDNMYKIEKQQEKEAEKTKKNK